MVYELEELLSIQRVREKINPFKPNEISHYYQMDQSISVFKGCWMVFFIFNQIFKGHLISKQWRP